VKRLYLLFTATMFATACGLLPTESGDPEGAVPWTPSRWFEAWWAKNEACSGLTGDLRRIRWFVVHGYTFDDPSGGERSANGQLAGLATQDGRVFLAGDWKNDPMVVRHEMLHQLLYQNGRGGGHPHVLFKQQCQLTVDSYRYDPLEDFRRDSVRRAQGKAPIIPENPYYTVSSPASPHAIIARPNPTQPSRR
jgi:hypothetical protein